MSDRLVIEGLTLAAIIGVEPHERVAPQPLILDIEIGIDAASAAASDHLDGTLDYMAVCRRIEAIAVGGRYHLLETLLHAIASTLAREMNIPWIKLKAIKPQAHDRARVGVIIEREFSHRDR